MLLQLEVWTLKLTLRCTWEIGAFLEAESTMLAATAEVKNPQSLKMHKSGLELWRLLKYNFGRASAFNVMGILESVRNMQTAKNVQDVCLEPNTLERRRQEDYRQAVGSKEP